MNPTDQHLLTVTGLTKHFPVTKGALRRPSPPVRAVDGVSLHIDRGETLGVVGESGSGKSTLLRLIARLLEPTAGSIRFDGTEVTTLDPKAMRALRRDIQIVFQDPYGSLNPRMTVGQLISEPWVVHPGVVEAQDHRREAQKLLEMVGLNANAVDQYPGEFSGGQRQRIGIARAVALRPRLILCDEPVSALDVSVQAQVINLLRTIQRELGVAYLFIGHDLSVVRAISDRIAVMYLGQIIETGTADEIHDRTRHPYTRALLSAVPEIAGDGPRRERIILTGEIPSPSAPPSGCRFRTRCWKAESRCETEEPALVGDGDSLHLTACHFPEVPPELTTTAESTS